MKRSLSRKNLIDRDTLNQHLGEMCAISPHSAGVDYASTGNTSGAPLRYYIGSERSAVEYAYLVASWARAGFRLGLPLAVFRGRAVPSDADGIPGSHVKRDDNGPGAVGDRTTDEVHASTFRDAR